MYEEKPDYTWRTGGVQIMIAGFIVLLIILAILSV